MEFIRFLVRHWLPVIAGPGIVFAVYKAFEFPNAQQFLNWIGLSDWTKILILIVLSAAVLFYMAALFAEGKVKEEVEKLETKIERVREEKKNIPTFSILQTKETYSQMKIDAENAEELFLTSFLSGHREGQEKASRNEYFKYIESVISNNSKPITRIEVFQQDSRKINRIEELVMIGARNPRFKLSALYQGDDYPLNLQIFYPVSAYVFDPVFAQDSTKTRARHIRFTGLPEISELRDRYDATLENSKIIKGIELDELNLSDLRKHVEDNEARAFLQERTPLVYDIALNHQTESYDFSHRTHLHSVSSLNWHQLAKEISEEEALISYSTQDLISRCEKLRSAVAVINREIVCHVSALTLLDAKIGKQLTGEKHHGLGESLRISEVQTGYTRSDVRRHRIFGELRAKLLRSLGRGDAQNDLVLSFCNGVAASPVLSKLGWRRFGWDRYPFVSSLVGWFEDETFYKVGVGTIDNHGRKAWNGKHTTYTEREKRMFDQYISIWASDKTPDERWLQAADENIRYKISSLISLKNNCDPTPSDEECLEWWREAIKEYFHEKSDVAGASFT